MRAGLIRIGLAWMVFASSIQVAGAFTSLTVWGGNPQQLLSCLSIEEGAPFTLEFINSIYLAPVRETFVYRAGEGISLIKVESPSAGVFEYYGLEPDGSGRALLSRSFKDIRIRSHDYENHRLIVSDRPLYFKGLIDDGEAVIIKVWTGERCPP